jgi:flavorubredoxin
VPQIRTLVQTTDRRAVLDVGGDGTGARVLGSLIDVIPSTGVDILLVLNFSRPSTPDVEHAVRMVHEIEATSQQRITGLISNTHLMQETTLDVVCEGAEMALETGHRLSLPVVAATVHEDVAATLDGRLSCPVFTLRRIVSPPFDIPEQRTSGPLFVVN